MEYLLNTKGILHEKQIALFIYFWLRNVKALLSSIVTVIISRSRALSIL